MKTIKKTFRAVSCGAKFHLRLLFQTLCPSNSKLHVDAVFTDPYIARVYKDFSLVCLSLICHNLVESSFKYFEAVKFSVTALPFK